jgi:hypothetical protein
MGLNGRGSCPGGFEREVDEGNTEERDGKESTEERFGKERNTIGRRVKR